MLTEDEVRLLGRVLLVVEVVKQAHDPPFFDFRLVGDAVVPRVRLHRGFNRHAVFTQRVGQREFVKQGQRFRAGFSFSHARNHRPQALASDAT